MLATFDAMPICGQIGPTGAGAGAGSGRLQGVGVFRQQREGVWEGGGGRA